MVGLVRKHVGEHGGSGRPRASETVAREFGDLPLGRCPQGIGEHAQAQLRALLMGGGSLLHCATVGVEPSGPPQVRSGVPKPRQPAVVQMGEDRGDGAARAALCFGHGQAPGAGVEVREQELIHRIVRRIGFQQDVANLDQGLEGWLWHGASVKFRRVSELGHEKDIAHHDAVLLFFHSSAGLEHYRLIPLARRFVGALQSRLWGPSMRPMRDHRTLPSANDLTGALEVGAKFAASRVRSVVMTGTGPSVVAHHPDVDAQVIDTETRRMRAEIAAREYVVAAAHAA